MDKTLAQGLYEISSVRLQDIGETIRLSNGDIFRYSLAGASALSAGKLGQAAAQAANHTNRTATATAAGLITLSLALGATAAVKDEYGDGWAMVNVAPGAGQSLRIQGHSAVSSSGTISLDLQDPVKVALTTSSKVTLVHNPNKLVVEGTSAIIPASGVPTVAVTASYFYWAKTHGPTPVLNDGALTTGGILIAGSVAGSVKDQADVTAPVTEVQVGVAAFGAGADTEYRPILLTID